MLKCLDCGSKFLSAETVTELHTLSSPPYEEYRCCPICHSTNIKRLEPNYCRCCGARISANRDYCSKECEARARRLRERELKRKQALRHMPINQILNELNYYNEKNGTRYSYGQYVTIIRPYLKKK